MNEPLISVVVPVYNVEKYVKQCLDSILAQSYKNLQIVVVDDGAKDSSGFICDEVAKTDNRIEVYHIENQGLSGARNEGMTHVKGEFVCFVDSDDRLGPFHIENLFVALDSTNSELAITGFTEFFVDSNLMPETKRFTEKKELTGAEALSIAIKLFDTDFREHAWGKLYAKALFPLLEYPLRKAYEDRYVCYKVMHNAKGIVYENANDYLYLVDRSDSIVNQRNIKNLDSMEASRLMYQYSKTEFPEVFDAVGARWFSDLIGGYTIAQLIGEKKIAKALYKDLLDARREALNNSKLASSTRLGYIVAPIKPLFDLMAVGNVKRFDFQKKRKSKKK